MANAGRSTFSNELTDAQLERLAILSEELGEAQQAIGKIIRHGYDSQNPDATRLHQCDNRDDLEKELGDIRFAITLLAESGDVNMRSIRLRRDEKAERIKPYLHHQEAPR